ncbi:hypothetical protein ACHAXS_000597, partial [Conticribra weissflogii]
MAHTKRIIRMAAVATGLAISFSIRNGEVVVRNSNSVSHHIVIHPATIESVTNFLVSLAQKHPSELWYTFGKDQTQGSENEYGDDPFSLKYLEKGECPWRDLSNIQLNKKNKITVDWLPRKPLHSKAIAEKFRNKYSLGDGDNQGRITEKKQEQGLETDELGDSSEEVILWFEHLSKAGGTSFCEIVKSNMPKGMVPNYHCMPRKSGYPMDGRVGSWNNTELIQYSKKESHRAVSNEWDPFDLNKLHLSGRKIDNGDDSDTKEHSEFNRTLPLGLNLLFLTTLRDPCDRLFSAYTFFTNDNPPTFPQWITNNIKRCGSFKPGSRYSYQSNMARLNHIVWRFSGGNLPHLPNKDDVESGRGFLVLGLFFFFFFTNEELWMSPFKTAIQSLANHDLVLPMDVMTKEAGKKALHQLLGWTHIEIKAKQYQNQPGSSSGHVVPRGGVKNSNARVSLKEDEYRA